MLTKLPSPLQTLVLRRDFGAGLLLASMLGALALQHLLGWQPCPLCILQRLTALTLLLCLVTFAWSKDENLRDFALWSSHLAAGTGVIFSASHLWLLANPQTETCGPGLALFFSQLVDALPGSSWFLEGAGACDDARYSILGIPLPGWAIAAHLIPWAHANWVAKKCN